MPSTGPLRPRVRQADHVDVFVGEQIRRHRLEKGTSQRDLARGIGVSQQQLQKYEEAADRVSASRLYRICRLLDCPIAAMFPEGDDQRVGDDVDGVADR